MSEPWDPEKAEGNLRKHGVDFPEAMTIERDPMRLTIEDQAHSGEEQRFMVIGMSRAMRLLHVTCTYRGDTMRPISARRATKRERNEYFR